MKSLLTNKWVILFGVFMSFHTYSAVQGNIGQDNASPQTKAERGVAQARKPPELAISICLGKAQASTCTFNGPQGVESGFCEYTPDNVYFACNPNRAGKTGNNPPPRRRDNLGEASSSPRITQYPSHLKSQ